MTPPDFRQYQDPSVYVEAVPFPTGILPVISPTVLALVGDSVKFQTFSEEVTLSGVLPATLTKLGIDDTTVVVRAKDDATVFSPSLPLLSNTPSTVADYRILQQNVAPNDTTTIQREAGSAIADGQIVVVTYSYTDGTYFTPKQYFDFLSLKAVYGEPFDLTTGAINSPVSLAALLAFQNGANEVWVSPVQTTSSNDFNAAIDATAGLERINALVVLTDDGSVLSHVQQHLTAMELQGVFRLAFLGLAPSSGSTSQLIAQAKSFGYPRIALCGPSDIQVDSGATQATSRVQDIAGYYLAAAVAGSFASRPVQVPLTHKQLFGILSIPNQETKVNMLAMQSAGVLLAFQTRTGIIIVKHGLTTQTSPESPINGTLYTQEVSIEAARDRLMNLLQDTLNASDLIGGVIDATTPDTILGVVTGALEVAVGDGLITDYGSVQFLQDPLTPTAVTVQFAFQPALPLNYILVQFALDTSSGALSDLTFSDVASVAANQ